MEVVIRDLANKEAGKVRLPVQFDEQFRPDLIKRAVEAIWSHDRQPYGADPRAGKRASANLSKRRRKYRGSYGKGISRVQRKIMTRRGLQFNWTAANVPQSVGGRRAHPPKAEKIWTRKLNDKERLKALRSAIAATMNKELVVGRGHAVPETYPFILSNDFENVQKTKELNAAFAALGFTDELARASVKRVRAGRGKTRGRKYQRAKGPLVVVADECKALKSARNIAGVDVVPVSRLNAKLLAPGCHAGRLTMFTQNAVEKLDKERLFL